MGYYKQIKKTERQEISILRRKGYSVSDIALELGRDRSTIYRELKRNLVMAKTVASDISSAASLHKSNARKPRRNATKDPHTTACGSGSFTYDAKKAHHKAYIRRKYAKYQAMCIVKDMKLREFIETKLLVDDWSPEQIAGRLASEIGLQKVSAPTIYKYIRSPQGRKLEYELDLVRKKRSSSKHKWQRKVTSLEDRIFIDKRPESANNRSQYGHWEADFIVSGKAYGNSSLLVLHERVSRYTLIARIEARTITNVQDTLTEALPLLGSIKSLTLDNDIAFRKHQEMSELLQAPIYFCQPYHSWEKGGVENANKLIRRYVPKGCDISSYTQREIWDIQHCINNKPRKILGYKTAREVYLENQLADQHMQNT